MHINIHSFILSQRHNNRQSLSTPVIFSKQIKTYFPTLAESINCAPLSDKKTITKSQTNIKWAQITASRISFKKKPKLSITVLLCPVNNSGVINVSSLVRHSEAESITRLAMILFCQKAWEHDDSQMRFGHRLLKSYDKKLLQINPNSLWKKNEHTQ